ncbi:glycosyltransferase [Gracilibacillus sp. S3-1-1]|uniref:Glycosyltransferase n=1 Tax=Gracilibacillus pellucidus TaxID=3095368 RepID=A0ACC6M7Z9_9BACI|nr:glycosyltransferase [Gracilibacillus sp. S3-1-1]MDX8047089.1 glycosyltransferase [Gracilibacillus sp. S3-1-1]
MSQKKNVVHLTTVHHPFDTRIYHKECLSLKEAGYDVTLIAPVDEQTKDQAEASKLNILPIKKHRNRWKRMLLGPLEVYKKAKKLKADVYHFHDPELIFVGWLLKTNNNKVIYDVHEDYYTSIMQKDYFAEPIKRIIGKLYNRIERFLIKRMELCLAEKYYHDRYGRGESILNYPIVNEKLINKEIKHETTNEQLLYTGNVSEVRGAYYHADIPKIMDKHVYFVGKCPSDLADKMKEHAGVKQDFLHFDGIDQFVEREVIDNYYINQNWVAGLAIFPATEHYVKKELTKFFEYMSAGLPIICSNFPTWQAFIDKHQCGIAVDPENPQEWIDAVEFLQNNPIEAEAMGYNGRKAVLQELSWESQEKKLVSWYEQLLTK